MSLFAKDGFDAFVSALAGTGLVDQWDSRVAKVGAKVFALLSPDPSGARITFKCGRDSFDILTAIEGIDQAPYFAKGQWVSISENADFPQSDLIAYLERSHAIVAKGLTRKARAELGLG